MQLLTSAWSEVSEATITKFRERFLNEFPEELNAAFLLDIDAE